MQTHKYFTIKILFFCHHLSSFACSNISIFRYFDIQHGQHIKRADLKELREVFDKYAKVEKDGEKFMKPEDFMLDYLGDGKRENLNIETARLIGSILDTTRDG